ncbi:pre-mRNA cleavage complex 2 protein Pcf11 [Brienomyrus brachyistius]|uniref:pre-mRNA cleavage complex 2 protein Pcf11 n=1 Tax=Brienomyrus brachyistius TaxID=42636 RepID=UPI0020B4142B|nr:pre-mRNA cleavage complex 2 protein Pcf11 [Brienomyrus brachyistius]
MSDDAAREDACREYQSSLEDLTFNSKPHINMLTILAEENLHFAKDIVAIIEAQIAKAPAPEKLPVLYLVDSIVKNVRDEYLAVFAKNIVNSFILVFEKVDENTRKSLFKLRSTWDEIFPLKKLYALDVRVNAVDPAWPIKPLPPNVNASIHVNPKFLKPSEEVTVPSGNAQQPPNQSVANEKSLTQEQAIRQQLLAKQKQLLELQQKKIELELEQTKAQLAANQLVAATNPPVNPANQHGIGARNTPLPPVQFGKPWHVMQPESKMSTRDPRLNRVGPTTQLVKEQVLSKKDGHCMASSVHPPEKKTSVPAEKIKFEKLKIPKKECPEEKAKSKSPSPLNKFQGKPKNSEMENIKTGEVNKRDPRLRKHLHDKPDVKDDECKDKKRFSDKKERDDSTPGARSIGGRNKLLNGSANKYDRNETLEKLDSKTNKASMRRRSRSRSRSPLSHSPKRKDRRSPKRRMRSVSSSPPKSGKGRQLGGKHLHPEEFSQHSNIREERAIPKKNVSEPRRQKRLLEERPIDSHSPRLPNELKENASKRWKSGWEENKHLKQPDENLVQGKSGQGPQRHKQSWSSNQRMPVSRIPKQHRLSVDANLQIPDVLNSASKRDLLKKASKRLAEGEISHDDFLNVAHQIKQLFQYQEEKQRSDSWDGSSEDAQFGTRKKPLLATPSSQQGSLSDAEKSYYEHKAKLRRTQVQHQGGRDHHSPFSERVQHGRPMYEDDEQMKGDPEFQKRYGAMPEGIKVEDSVKPVCLKHEDFTKERPSSDPGSSFKNSPSPVNFDGLSGKSPVSGFDCSANIDIEGHQMPVRESSPNKRFGIPSSCEHSVAGCDSEVQLSMEVSSGHHDASGQGRSGQPGPLLCESPGQTPPHVLEGPHTQSGLSRYDGPKIAQRFDGQQPLIFEGNTNQPILDGPTRPHLQGRFDNSGPGRFDGSSRFDAPQGSGRFDGAPIHKGPERFDGSNRYDAPTVLAGPQRFGEPQGLGRFNGPHPQQVAGRFEGPVGQQAPTRFDGQSSVMFDGPQMQPNRFDGPMRFEGPHMQQGPGRYEGRFVGPQAQQGPSRYEGPSSQQGRMRFDGPVNQPGGIRFEHGQGQIGPMRYDGQQQGMARFDCAPSQQGAPRYCGPLNLQSQMRPHCPSMFDNAQGQNQLSNPGPQSNFNMPSNRFAEPLNVFGAAPQSFQGQQNLSQGHNFNVQPAAGTSGFSNSFVRPVSSYFNPGAPAGNMGTTVPGGNIQQPMNMLPGLKTQISAPYGQGQPIVQLQQNPVPFNQTGSQFPPESHFGQVDVNDLLSKLISTGIIKPAQTDSTSTGMNTPPQSQPAVEEEEEEEQGDDQNVPDLTAFAIEDMKQRYDSVITKLYTGIQCYSCGMRFTASQTDVYADHLDWHYRQNRLEKDISKKVTHRRWYYSLMDWIEFEEIADLEERAKSQFFEKVHEEVEKKTQEAAKEKEFLSVKAAPDVVGETCEICQEQFEMYWEEEEEEWHLKNAIRVDEKTYHPSCYEDYKNTSSFVDCTPSPNKALMENPLNVFIKEENDPSSCSSIKQEPDMQSSCTDANAEEAFQVKVEEESQASAIIF